MPQRRGHGCCGCSRSTGTAFRVVVCRGDGGGVQECKKLPADTATKDSMLQLTSASLHTSPPSRCKSEHQADSMIVII